MERNDWATTQAGQAKKNVEYNSEIFPRGFITGLRKFLGIRYQKFSRNEIRQ